MTARRRVSYSFQTGYIPSFACSREVHSAAMMCRQELSELQAPSPLLPGPDWVGAPPSHPKGLWPGSGLSKTKSHDTSPEKQNHAQVKECFCPASGRHPCGEGSAAVCGGTEAEDRA